MDRQRVGEGKPAPLVVLYLHESRESPNGLRLSGERGGAERVRCSRALDAA
jgi:hypothetical protein